MRNIYLVLSYFKISILALTLSISIIYSQEIDELEVISPENINNVEELYVFESFDDSIKSINFLSDNTSLIVVQGNEILSLNIMNNQIAEVASFDKFLQSSVLSDDGTLLACMCSSQSPVDDFLLLDVETGQELLSLVDLAPATGLAIDSQNKYVVTATGWTRESSKVQVWDIEEQNMLFELPANGWTSKVTFSPNSKYVAAGFTALAQVWDLHSLSEVFSIEQSFKVSEQGAVNLKIGDIVFSPDNKQVASMSPEGFIWIWDTSSGEMLALLNDESIAFDKTQSLYSLPSTNINYSPDGKLIATSNGQALNIWDISTETLIYDIEGISDFLFSMDGRFLVTVDANNKVALWGIKTK